MITMNRWPTLPAVFLDGHFILSRSIAERGRYPAIDLLKSVSRCLPDAATDEENVLINDARAMLGIYEENEAMIKAGLYVSGSDPTIDRAISLWAHIDQFAASRSAGDHGMDFQTLASLLSGPGNLPDQAE